MDKQRAQLLLKAYLAGTCTPEEKALLESWYQKTEGKELPVITQQKWDNQLEEIWAGLPVHQESRKFWQSSYFAAAAIILLCLITGLYFFSAKNTVPSKTNQLTVNDIPPGSNKAILTLADGSRITLSGTSQDKIVTENGIIISRTTDGQLIYRISTDNNEHRTPGYNSVETPVGGSYMIILPDSTKVWLNAASMLKYPLQFLDQRRVELKGEAYFEVAKNKKKPFIVYTPTQQVSVLGTHFNINSYTNEPDVQTTLLEGSVVVNVLNQQSTTTESVTLKPGQQSRLQAGKLTVGMVDINKSEAWKNDFFVFKDADIQTVMRAVERWYNVEVVYQGAPPKRSFSGEIYRNINLKEFLAILDFNNVHFHINGKKIWVTP
ncbi:hypothetical protein TH53_09020 [Pedobacter lusitanus]|uniref:FecR protein n=1 Tax=Pedobacter lusitanus TaxID=1503925 RepID=A0A0D0GSL2_9SPHI|nr:FecR family protein [Pedobacter lusitanus]KIO77416.1 hypothetical protein TH53_09020 [Pedobacter lusitanus]